MWKSVLTKERSSLHYYKHRSVSLGSELGRHEWMEVQIVS